MNEQHIIRHYHCLLFTIIIIIIIIISVLIYNNIHYVKTNITNL